jgi:hypothetical protein
MYRNYIKSISYKREHVHVNHWTCSLLQLTNETVNFTTLDLTVYSPSSQKNILSQIWNWGIFQSMCLEEFHSTFMCNIFMFHTTTTYS